jgi:hypothetical protein
MAVQRVRLGQHLSATRDGIAGIDAVVAKRGVEANGLIAYGWAASHIGTQLFGH